MKASMICFSLAALILMFVQPGRPINKAGARTASRSAAKLKPELAPMGWNSYDCYGMLIIEAALRPTPEEMLIDFSTKFDIASVETRDAKIKVEGGKDGGALRVTTGHSLPDPGLTFKAPQGEWNLTAFQHIAFDIKNLESVAFAVRFRIENPGAEGMKGSLAKQIDLRPGEKKNVRMLLPRALPAQLAPRLFGMNGYPGGLLKEAVLDIGKISRLVLFVSNPKTDHVFEVGRIRASGTFTPPAWVSMSESEFFPMIDEFGQFIHKDWPRKTHSVDDLKKYYGEEDKDLARNPGPDDWDKFGGWKAGPQLTATGYFRVEKYNGQWWLVDPEGRLFWSHGSDCVRSQNGVTPITDRKHLFRALPDQGSPVAQFYGQSSWAPQNYYQGKGTYETFNFQAANLFAKYGSSWPEAFSEISHRRLWSWGMNTVANWSDEEIYLKRKTPYVVPIGFGGKLLEGSQGYWGKFKDVYDPNFKEEIRKGLDRQKEKSAGDPWCIGYFVDNEASWGDEVSLAVATLTSPPGQEAKKVFVLDLKAKYGTVDKLNQAWGAQYASWENILESRRPPDRTKASEDLRAFYTKTAETYFQTIREAVKEIAPDNLYLGCRFAWVNPLAVKAAEKFCDVISYNLYVRDIENFRLPEDINWPVIVGEFHFGALDRGMFHTGLQETESQAERASAYKRYVIGALRNPLIIGTHWFQYSDQATTGRGDGENYQIGFLDIADTPYLETIEACRTVGYRMYEIRSAVSSKSATARGGNQNARTN